MDNTTEIVFKLHSAREGVHYDFLNWIQLPLRYGDMMDTSAMAPRAA